MSAIAIRSLPISKLFIDAKDEKIFAPDADNPTGFRVPHPTSTNGPSYGYQRDPWTRQRWINARMPNFSDVLCRPVEVSDRKDGSYAAIDGGGRIVMATLAGRDTVVCRIHQGLNRRQEAQLFSEFNSEVYKLRSVDTFIAQCTAGEPMAVAIAKAAKPYAIAPSGSGTIKCVGPLTSMYLAFAPDHDAGIALIKQTCQISAGGWSGWTKASPPTGRQIESKFMMELGMVVEAANGKLDDSVLRKVLQKYPTPALEKLIVERSDIKLGTVAFAIAAAKHLARAYNRSFAGKVSQKIALPDIDNSSFLGSLQEGGTYASHARAARLRDIEDLAEAAE